MKTALNLDLTRSNARSRQGDAARIFVHCCRCFLRRVMVILLQQKNFGPNVIYLYIYIICMYYMYLFYVSLICMYYDRNTEAKKARPKIMCFLRMAGNHLKRCALMR